MPQVCLFLLLPLLASPASATSLSSTAWPYGWVLGLVCGVALMIAFDIDWRSIPDRIRRVIAAVRRKAGWAAVGIGSLGVILFY